MERLDLYPMLFEPNLHSTVWGGERIVRWKKLPESGSVRSVGESWEVSCVEGSPSVVKNGAMAGRLLPDVIAASPEEILGHSVAVNFNRQMPLLIKYIDARQDLSIQVHPNDAMAQREHGKMGKTEMWYIIDAEPGASIYSGFRKELTPDEYRRMVADGTITDALARHEVKAGDVFFIPAGRVHAICGGVLLAEIQQSSDVTYRIFDYNRPGLDGRPRELHTELAARALDFNVETNYRTEYNVVPNKSCSVVENEYFSVTLTKADRPLLMERRGLDSFIVTMCIKGNCRIVIRSTREEIMLREGFSCMIPAAVADYEIIPAEGISTLLEAFVNTGYKEL